MKKFLLFLLLATPAYAGTIPITGTIRQANGNGFNGSIKFTLSYSAGLDMCSNYIVVAQTIQYRVSNGTLPTNATITGNDCIQPKMTWYTAQYLTAAGQVIAQNNFYVTGSQFNIGTSVPTPVTTNNLSFDLTQFLPTQVATDCSTFPGSDEGAKVVNCIASFSSAGGIADARSLSGAQNISVNVFGGVNKPVQLLLGAGTINMSVGQATTYPCVCSIIGMGSSSAGGTVINWTGGSGAAIALGADDETLSQFELTGANVTGEIGILIDYPIGNLVTRVTTRTLKTHIKVDNGLGNAFVNSIINNDIQVDNGSVGIYTGQGSDGLSVSFNSIRGSPMATSGVCIHIAQGASIHIISNLIEHCAGNDVIVDGSEGTVDSLVFDSNYMETTLTTDYMVVIDNSHSNVYNTQLSYNYFQAATGPSAYCINVTDASNQVNFIGNRFIGFSTSGIHNQTTSGNNSTARINLENNFTLGASIIDSMIGVARQCPAANSTNCYFGGRVGIGEAPQWPLDVTIPNAGDAAAKITNTSVTGFGLSVTPGADDNTHYSLNLTNAANTQNRHQFFGNGTFNIGNGSTHLDNITANIITDSGGFIATAYGTGSVCQSIASPAACGSAAAGAVAIATSTTGVVVDTTAVTAFSNIFLQEDPSLGPTLGITCNTVTGRTYTISARSGGSAFQITSSGAPGGTAACLSYHIIN